MEVAAPMLNMGAQSPLCRAIPCLSALLCSIENKNIINNYNMSMYLYFNFILSHK